MIARNIRLLKWDNFFGGLWPLSTLSIVYFQTITQSYALAMAVFSLASLATTVFEIPMGMLSDTVGRRKTLIYSAVAVFICFILWALAGQYYQMWLLFVGALLWAMADALLSGTDEALIYETMEELGCKEDFDVLFSKSRGWNQIGLAFSALSAAFITYFFSLQTLAWISVVPVLGQFIIACLYVEPKRSAAPRHGTSFKQFLIALRRLWKNKKMRFYAFVNMIDDAVGFSAFRFESLYYEELISLWLINIARFLKQACGTVSFFIVPKIKKLGSVKIFFTSMAGNVAARLVGLGLNNFLSPFIMASVNLFYGTSTTSLTTILQQEFSPQQRATMRSIISFGKGILMAAVMYLFGVLADVSTPRFALFLAVFVKLAVLVFSLSILKLRRV